MERSKPVLTPGATFAARYEVVCLLGQGGMGEVYRVVDRQVGEEVALKLLRPEITLDPGAIDRFRNELRSARRISHPNICRVYHLGAHQGTYYITMELVSGQDLKSCIHRSGPFEPEQVLSVARQVCEGLAEAHRSDVIHRDLKPHNIMLDARGKVRVMDFGIARHLGSDRLTRTGAMVGTPEYMSPEQIDGAEVDGRSDLYSLGVILFEMTTGRLPFEGPSPLAVAVKHLMADPPDPRTVREGIAEELAGLISRCLTKDKLQRYQTAEDLLAELARVEQALAGRSLSSELAPSSASPHSRAHRATGHFVAREAEMARLETLLAEALFGQGRVAFVTGDAGTGKTALLSAFAKCAEGRDPLLVVARGRCDAHTGAGDPYEPFREILSQLTGDLDALQAAGVTEGESFRRIPDLTPRAARSVLVSGPDLVGTLISGAGLLERAARSAPGEDWIEDLGALVRDKRALPADSTLQQSHLLEQTTRVLLSIAKERSLVLIIDDLQWADTSSVNSIFHLARRLAGSRILVLGAYRPAEVALGRNGQRHPVALLMNELRRDFGDVVLELDRVEDRRFLDAFLDSYPNRFSDVFRETFFRHTRGHPLFTVELFRALRERALVLQDPEGDWAEAEDIDWQTVPARVDATVEERVGRLPAETREILRSASVEGEEFTAEVVARVQGIDLREVLHVLSAEVEKRHHLVRARGISRVNGTRLSRYAFQHNLFQRHLYEELDAVERPFLHQAVGGALEELYGDGVGEVAVQLARHFHEAKIPEKAIDYLRLAGQQAVRMSANEEAIAHFFTALRLLEDLPEGPERRERELALQLAVVVPLQWARGFAAPELARAAARARELCEQIRNPAQTFAALAQLTLLYATRPEYRVALELADQLPTLIEEVGDSSLEIVPVFLRTWPLMNLGLFEDTVRCSEQAMASYVPERDNLTAYIYGFELGVLSLVFESWARWFLGYPDHARRDLDRGLELARTLGHPHTLAFTLVGACELHWFLRDADAVHRYTEELAPLSREHGFAYWEAHALFYQAEERIRDGQVREGISQLHQGIAGMRATGTETCLTRLLCRMAGACEEVAAYDEASAAIDAASRAMEEHDERYMEAEIHRHRGELALIRGDDVDRAEAHFARAIAVSRAQKANSLELRATMSLARLWRELGKGPEARQRLASVYSRFTEGFETPDVRDARVMLQSLGGMEDADRTAPAG
jgi:adenylate cyclase